MGGSLEEKEFTSLIDRFPYFKDLKVFIETGTYLGHSSRCAAGIFDEVYTFEIQKELHDRAIATAEEMKITNIQHFLGDSVELLPSVIISKCIKPAFFFLDAHQSGSDTSNNGKEFVPVLSELKMINTLYPAGQLAVICVDDCRLWKQEVWDWVHVTNGNILNALSNHKVVTSFEENDRFYVIINH